MKPVRARQENCFGLGYSGIGDATIDRTGGRTFLVIEKANTFSAFVWNYIVDVRRNRLVYLTV
jgi:hypothetical protein